MKNKYYLDFLEDYPKEKPCWLAGLKYMVTRQDQSNYYIGKNPISKSLDGKVYKIKFVKTPENFLNNF